MPAFRFNKALSIARDVKVFLSLQGGVTRGAVPYLGVNKKQAQKLNDSRRLDRDKIKKQAETLMYAQQHVGSLKEEIESQKREIFRLRNELRTVEEQAESATNGRSALQAAVESETGALPDFVIIGAQKSGTTFLYDLLTRHPYVEPAFDKESRYFQDNFHKGIEWYRSQFLPPRWKDGQRSITGEATPYYLFHPRVPERMSKVVPQVRLIALLRNPVDRAYSHHNIRVRTLREDRSFEEVIEAEKEWLFGEEAGAPEHQPRARVGRPRFECQYLSRGTYVDHLLHWSKFFSKEQMLVLKSEDLYESTLDTLKLVLDFLDLPDWEPEAPENLNLNKGHYEEMDPATRQWLEDYFEPHNRRLYEYLGMDFGW